MKPVDIINVAGLLMDGKDDGIEQALREKLHPRFLRTIAPTPVSSMKEDPRLSILRAVTMIREVIADSVRQFGESNVLLVGRSLGAYTALLAALEMDFENIPMAILIEGPLHPEVTVEPPTLLPPLMACGAHYRMRPEYMRRAVERIQELDAAHHLLIVQGGGSDSVVPLEAQILPGNFETIQLPPHIGGRSLGLQRPLPEGYRNHLFWSEEKMSMIVDIIQKATGGPHGN